jgi:hypothetical protein
VRDQSRNAKKGLLKGRPNINLDSMLLVLEVWNFFLLQLRHLQGEAFKHERNQNTNSKALPSQGMFKEFDD